MPMSRIAMWAQSTAPDKYTVVMNWKITNPEIILETMQAHGGDTCQENPEAVKTMG